MWLLADHALRDCRSFLLCFVRQHGPPNDITYGPYAFQITPAILVHNDVTLRIGQQLHGLRVEALRVRDAAHGYDQAVVAPSLLNTAGVDEGHVNATVVPQYVADLHAQEDR